MSRKVFGQIGTLKSEKVEEYKKLHANAWPGVLKTISDCNLQNYSIFLQGNQVFSYFEYVGEDYEGDMKKMEADKVTQEWWKHTKPCFEKYSISPESEFYHDMEQIFYYE
ncbi:MAG: L-rhamnose mutarotase [Lachnospiraceae bacterium]|nr:L-rhamnose mutarotase [Lachnospiraceae bacterium]